MLELLSQPAAAVLKDAYGIDVPVAWQLPQDPSHGDVSTSIALQLAKQLGKLPREIAEQLALGLRKSDYVATVDVAGAGYVNVFLRPEIMVREVQKVREVLKAKPLRKEAPVIVDFAGPNIAKPLGVHHLGSHIIGQAIINIYRHTGTNVIGWSYLGDWGTQFGKLAVAYEKWGDGKPPAEHTVEELLSLYVRFHQEVENDPTLEDQARAAFKKIEDGDPELRAFWADVVKVTKEDLERIYQQIHVQVDVETGESFYEDKMGAVLEEGIKKGVFQTGEGGALVVLFPEEKNLPPLMVRKSDGSTLYVTRDLAMIRYRIDTYHPAAMYYVVDVAQSLHFQQLFAAAEQLGWELPVHEHSLFGRMRFKDASMSTRKGTSLRMEALLEEAVKRAADIIQERGDTIQTDDPKELAEMMGIGAIMYGLLSQNRKMDIIFDWERMLSFEGNSAPYLQYTHARARSVLRKADGANAKSQVLVPERFTEHERSLMRALVALPGAIEEARTSRMPHKLANALYQLAQDFNAFYNADTILNAEEPARSFRLALTELTADALRTGCGLLTIRVPDRM